MTKATLNDAHADSGDGSHPPPRVTNGYLRFSTSADEPSPGWRALYPALQRSSAKDSRRGKHHDRPLDLSARAS